MEVNYLISVETWNFHYALGLQWTLFFLQRNEIVLSYKHMIYDVMP